LPNQNSNQSEIRLDDLYFFAVEDSQPDNAIAGERFEGYIGLFPTVDHATGFWNPKRPSVVNRMVDAKIIAAPIVAIDLNKKNL
jgi:hypothetical protein